MHELVVTVRVGFNVAQLLVYIYILRSICNRGGQRQDGRDTSRETTQETIYFLILGQAQVLNTNATQPNPTYPRKNNLPRGNFADSSSSGIYDSNDVTEKSSERDSSAAHLSALGQAQVLILRKRD